MVGDCGETLQNFPGGELFSAVSSILLDASNHLLGDHVVYKSVQFGVLKVSITVSQLPFCRA